MTLINIPFDPSIKFQQKRLNLDGNDYVFEFGFNQRNETWYFNMSDSSGNKIIESHPLVLGCNLLEYISGVKPNGIFGLYSISNRTIIADGDNLGKDILIVYAASEA